MSKIIKAKRILEEIKAVDDGLGQYIEGFDDALDTAIRSLKAWDELKCEISEQIENLKDLHEWGKSIGMERALEIVNVLLQEVEK